MLPDALPLVAGIAAGYPGSTNSDPGKPDGSQNQKKAAWGLYGFSAGFSAMSARRDAQTKKNELGYQAQVDSNNAAIAGYQAQIAQQVGAAKEQDSRLQTAAQFGAERAHMAAGGIDLGQGSATDVLASTEYMGERNAAMIRDDTNRQVWQYHNQQAAYTADQQARLAEQSAINPDMAAFGSLLGSASSFAMSQWGK
jgi:hypothetical protein